jgi:nitrogen fixation protein FixH
VQDKAAAQFWHILGAILMIVAITIAVSLLIQTLAS